MSPPSVGDGNASAGELPTLRVAGAPAEQAPEDTTPFAAPPKSPPIEAQLVKLGLLTVGQLAEAHRQRLETGRPVLEIAIEKGWVDPAKIVELGGELPAPTARPAETEPAAEAALAPAVAEVEPEPEPATPPAVVEPEAPTKPFYVFLHLKGGERVPVGEADGTQRAEALAREVVAEVTRSGADKWPFYASRFIRPDSIVSVDVVEGELPA